MKRIEKTVFICYRRADKYAARLVFNDLTHHGYDAFIDYNGIPSGDFEVAILENIRSRAHFVVLLTPTALDRCHEPDDWVRREIEAALEFKRNVVPLLLDGFEFASPLAVQQLQGSLEPLRRYQAIAVPKEIEYFDIAMKHLRDKHLAVPLAAVLHPASAHAQKVAQEQRSIASRAAAGTIFRDKLKDGGEGPLMVVIPAGRFLMGSAPDEPGRRKNEDPQHEVVISQAYAMGAYPVIFDEYDRFCDVAKRQRRGDRGWGRGSRPAINITWEDAQAYCAWLTQQSGQHYRMPSEAEWECACRGRTSTPFHFGEYLTTDQANFNGGFTYNGSAKGEYRGKTTPVGSFPPNDFGLYDMHGNVSEWCQDIWHDNYNGAPADGSPWDADRGASHVRRGGSWFSVPKSCRAASRDNSVLDFRVDYIGFRVCCSSRLEPLAAGTLNTEMLKA